MSDPQPESRPESRPAPAKPAKLALDERPFTYAELVAAKDQLAADDLLPRLRDGRATVRANALLGLAAIGHTGGEIVPFLRDSDARVARAAGEAIAELGAAQRKNIVAIAAALDGARPEVADSIARMFAELIGVADAELIAVLDTSGEAPANAIIRACARVGIRGLRLLEAASADLRTRVRINAVRGVALLGELEHGRSMEVLADVERGDQVSDVRAATRTAIAKLAARTRAAASVRRKAMDLSGPAVPQLEQRTPTADELRAAANTAATSDLVHALSDGRLHVRLNAVRALALKGAAAADPSTARALAVLLRDPDSTIRLEAALALGKLEAGAAAAATPLVRALGDADGAVAANAETALAGLGAAVTHQLVEGLDTPNDLHGARVAGLIGQLPDGPRLLHAALGSTSVDVRVHAALGLAALGKARAGASVQAIATAALGGNKRLRAAVGKALAMLDPRPQRTPPRVAIDGFDDRVLAEAQLEQGKAALAAAGAAGLVDRMTDVRPAARANAALGLGVLGGDALLHTHALAACLRDDAPEVRLAAARALDKLGDEAVAASARDLIHALGDPDPQLAQRIADALRARKSRPSPDKHDPAAAKSPGEVIDDALGRALDAAPEPLASRVLELVCARGLAIDILSDALERPMARALAAKGFIALGKERLGTNGRAALERARIDPSAAVRDLATATLRAIDGEPAAPEPPAVAGFETQLLEPDAFAKAGKLDAAALVGFLHDGVMYVRANAATALGALGAAAAQYASALGVLLRDDDWRVRLAAARAIDKLGDDAVVAVAPYLVGALRGDERVASAVKPVLAARKAKVEAALVAGLETGDEAHGMRVAELICALPNAKDILFDAFDGPAQNVTINAALGIGMLGAERAGASGRRRLQNGLAGPFTRRREAMVKALALLGPEPEPAKPAKR